MMVKTPKTTRRSKVNGLPKAEKELTGDEARKVKGGYVINWAKGAERHEAAIKDGTSNTLLVSEDIK